MDKKEWLLSSPDRFTIGGLNTRYPLDWPHSRSKRCGKQKILCPLYQGYLHNMPRWPGLKSRQYEWVTQAPKSTAYTNKHFFLRFIKYSWYQKLFQIHLIDQWNHAGPCITSWNKKLIVHNEIRVKEGLYFVCTFSVTTLLLLFIQRKFKKVQKLRNKWTHVRRMDRGRLPIFIISYQPCGKRNQERPLKRIPDC